MINKLLLALFFTLLVCINPLFLSYDISYYKFVDDQPFLLSVIKFLGFSKSDIKDGLNFLFFIIIFIYIFNLIKQKRNRLSALLILTCNILIYIGVLYNPESTFISILIVFLIVGIVNSSSDRITSVFFLLLGNLVNFWFSVILMILLIIFYKYCVKNEIFYVRLILTFIDSIIFASPLILLISHNS